MPALKKGTKVMNETSQSSSTSCATSEETSSSQYTSTEKTAGRWEIFFPHSTKSELSVTANTKEEALAIASRSLGCAVTELQACLGFDSFEEGYQFLFKAERS